MGWYKLTKKGEIVFEGLIRSFLLEQVGNNCVRMRDETRVILVAEFVPCAYGLYLKQDGSKSNRIPNIEEWDAREIHLSNNIISELPGNPNCPILVNLFLHFNQDLIDIPFTFFDNMPIIQVLDLSSTSIKCLPSSISKLTTLGKLFIRDCDLLMELPPEIGALKNLKVFDSEGTQLVSFVKLPKCLTYTNGEGDTKVIARVLEHANALFLDRHWSVQSLSAFGLAEMEKLKFCLLSECNEMLQIVNGRHLEDFFVRPVLGSLQHLSIHYMKSLGCILNGSIYSRCLSNLKTLTMHSCPELRTIFTQGLLESLSCLEFLIVEDCTTITSLVSVGSYHSTSTRYLPSLKKISLLHLPELVSISRGISIAPRLVSLVVYDCPKLEKLSCMKASDHIKEIKGENEWWDAWKWCKPEWTSGQPDYLTRVFIPLGTNGDIMDELADAVNILPHLSD